MSTRDQLLNEIEAFLVEFDISAAAFGKAAMRDAKFVRRLRDGSDLTLGSADRVRLYMAEVRKAGRPRKRAQPVQAAA